MRLDLKGHKQDDTAESEDPKVFSVSEINKAIRGLLEGEFNLIWVRGEISNFKAHTSGHFYFSLKDENAQINAVMFRGYNSKMKFKPEDGLEVLIRGKITVYEPRGNYQIFCEMMEPVGAGALQKAFEQLKAKLHKEGLFAPERKRALPLFPKHVAVVTSPTGAAIRDILNVLSRRYRGLQVTIVPALVQGEQAAPSIVEAIRLANSLADVDVLIVGRGGGSIEDLWCFNDEGVARAIYSSRIPVISAVGHEVDFTIADFVADLRAPTPSAAAELVVQNAQELIERVQIYSRQLRQQLTQQLQAHRRHLSQVTKRLIDPQRRVQDLALRCDELSQRLENAIFRNINQLKIQIDLQRSRMGSPAELLRRSRQQLEYLSALMIEKIKVYFELQQAEFTKFMALLDSFSPLKVVERGYSITKKANNIVKSSTQLQTGDRLELIFANGGAEVEVKKVILKIEEKKHGF